jgi:hypothetical protein
MERAIVFLWHRLLPAGLNAVRTGVTHLYFLNFSEPVELRFLQRLNFQMLKHSNFFRNHET